MSPYLFRKPCLNCGVLVLGASRCEPCAAKHANIVDSRRDKSKRAIYAGNYSTRAKAIRENASVCWLCGEGARPTDPWQADHVVPDDPDSPLAPAHRSCNIKRALNLRQK